VVQTDGQKIEFGETRRVSLARPDRLRIEEVASDGLSDLALFDGKQITVLSADDNVYAQAPQPPSLEDALVYYVATTRADAFISCPHIHELPADQADRLRETARSERLRITLQAAENRSISRSGS
jgi:hypothetical protein